MTEIIFLQFKEFGCFRGPHAGYSRSVEDQRNFPEEITWPEIAQGYPRPGPLGGKDLYLAAFDNEKGRRWSTLLEYQLVFTKSPQFEPINQLGALVRLKSPKEGRERQKGVDNAFLVKGKQNVPHPGANSGDFLQIFP